MISRGQHLAPLPSGLMVYRFIRNVDLRDGGPRVGTQALTLSTADLLGKPPHASVWESTLSSDVECVRSHFPTLEGLRRFYLHVDDVRANAECAENDVDIVWTYLEEIAQDRFASGVPECLLGHAGIVGPLSSKLAQGSVAKLVREALAGLATLVDE